jgi:hypothetical protein
MELQSVAGGEVGGSSTTRTKVQEDASTEADPLAGLSQYWNPESKDYQRRLPLLLQRLRATAEQEGNTSLWRETHVAGERGVFYGESTDIFVCLPTGQLRYFVPETRKWTLHKGIARCEGKGNFRFTQSFPEHCPLSYDTRWARIPDRSGQESDPDKSGLWTD